MKPHPSTMEPHELRALREVPPTAEPLTPAPRRRTIAAAGGRRCRYLMLQNAYSRPV